MLLFRKMKMDDLEYIYGDDDLKSLLTVPPLGDKFGMLIEEDGEIKGGMTGYTKDQGAMIQMLKIKNPEENFQLAEGLIRASIFMLDLEDIKIVLTKSDEIAPYKNIGFKKGNSYITELQGEIDKIILDDISKGSFIYLDVESFFDQPCCN